MKINNINIGEYDYCLPEGRIAQIPAEKRDESKLLLYIKGIISKDCFKNIDKYLPNDSLLVFNNTRVIRARLIFRKGSGATIEVFCLEPLLPADYSQSFSSTNSVVWKCVIGNLKKWKEGILTFSATHNNQEISINAEKVGPVGDAWKIKFTWQPADLSFGEIIELLGKTPLPPYIKRDASEEDKNRYQTVYSKIDGSVAAPTAGLHFTPEVLSRIKKNGIELANITLHVGAGTFKPLKGDTIDGHVMHCEHYMVDMATIDALTNSNKKVIAVGTTSVRTLESLYWLGTKLLADPDLPIENLFTEQWEPYRESEKVGKEQSLSAIKKYMEKNNLSHISASTKIMVVPGYQFNIINGLITNFHQPKSTLLLLLAAWVGEEWKEIYNYALDNDFRFLSYGDSSLLL